MLQNTGLMNAATTINMGESFTLTVNGTDVRMVGVFEQPLEDARIGSINIDQVSPAMLVDTRRVNALTNQPVKGKSTITRKSGLPMTISSIQSVEGDQTRLEVSKY